MAHDLHRSRSFQVSFLSIMLWAIIPHLIQLHTASAVYPVTPYGQGGDFKNFYIVAGEAMHGELDLRKDFYKPPFIALLLAPLTLLDPSSALLVLQLTTLFLVSLVVILTSRAVNQSFWPTLGILLCIILSYPFAFLFDRGNLDGLSLGMACLAFLLVSKHPVAGVLLLAFSAHIKSNTLVLFPALIISTSFSASLHLAMTGAGAVLFLALLTPQWSLEWLKLMVECLLYAPIWAMETGSPFRLFLGLDHAYQFGITFVLLAVSLAYAGLVRQSIRGSVERPVWRLLVFLPFCQLFPPQSFLYGYVYLPLLLLLYCTLPTKSIFARLALFTGCVGVVLSCFPAGFLFNFLNKPWWPFFIPPTGLALITVTNTALIWMDTCSRKLPVHSRP